MTKSPPVQFGDFVITRFGDRRFYFNQLQVLNYLAGHPPFSNYALKNMLQSVATQMGTGCYVAAIKDNELCGYLGWLLTTREIADAWMANQGQLRRAHSGATAAVVTILAVSDPTLLLPMVRQMNKRLDGLPVRWKRHIKSRGLISRRLERQ